MVDQVIEYQSLRASFATHWRLRSASIRMDIRAVTHSPVAGAPSVLGFPVLLPSDPVLLPSITIIVVVVAGSSVATMVTPGANTFVSGKYFLMKAGIIVKASI